MSFILGIDTSCYTTSIAVVDNTGKLIGEKRKTLPVDNGKRGLSQSQAMFYHVKFFPKIYEELSQEVKGRISAVCASDKPRNAQRSYMPVFVFSESMGRSIAAAVKTPFYTTSHQEGHIMAGIWSAKLQNEDKFIAVHFSGGTSEILLVHNNNNQNFNCELIGSSEDLHAGQFVDRVGVAMGLDFPAGRLLQNMAENSKGLLNIPAAVKDLNFSFSGPESCAQRMISQGESYKEIARAVEKCILKTLEKVLINAVNKYDVKNILMVGGVSANRYIRNHLHKNIFNKRTDIKVLFADPSFCSDNAVGTALIGKNKFIG